MGAVRFIREKNCVIVQGPTAPSLARQGGPFAGHQGSTPCPGFRDTTQGLCRFPGLRLMCRSPWLHNMGHGSSKSSVAWKCVRLPGGARASDTCRAEGAESAAVFGSGTEPSL
ncbi:unnamed protein product [Arctogadus glacialis]